MCVAHTNSSGIINMALKFVCATDLLDVCDTLPFVLLLPVKF
jgi:hypothetical protein